MMMNVLVADLLDKPGGAVSVLAGGCVPGWSPEVAVVLWRRILGCLGNVNKIRDAAIHEQVYEFLCDLISTLVKVTLLVSSVYQHRWLSNGKKIRPITTSTTTNTKGLLLVDST